MGYDDPMDLTDPDSGGYNRYSGQPPAYTGQPPYGQYPPGQYPPTQQYAGQVPGQVPAPMPGQIPTVAGVTPGYQFQPPAADPKKEDSWVPLATAVNDCPPGLEYLLQVGIEYVCRSIVDLNLIGYVAFF